MPPEAGSSASSSGRRELSTWLLGTAVAVAVLLGAVVAMGGRVGEAATWGLVVAAGAMVFALRSLYGMAMALARPPIESTLEQEDVAAVAGVRELREERRRVLRAINELRFDYEMGKLSDEDYAKVREGYELRAVEVMRALESESSLHAELEVELRRRGLLEDEAGDAGDGVAAEPDPTEARDEGSSEDEAAEAAEAGDDDAAAEPDHAEARAEARDEGSSEDEDASGADEARDGAPAEPEQAAEDGAQDESAATVSCGACGGVNDSDAKFCKHCGAELGARQEAAEA